MFDKFRSRFELFYTFIENNVIIMAVSRYKLKILAIG